MAFHFSCHNCHNYTYVQNIRGGGVKIKWWFLVIKDCWEICVGLFASLSAKSLDPGTYHSEDKVQGYLASRNDGNIPQLDKPVGLCWPETFTTLELSLEIFHSPNNMENAVSVHECSFTFESLVLVGSSQRYGTLCVQYSFPAESPRPNCYIYITKLKSRCMTLVRETYL